MRQMLAFHDGVIANDDCLNAMRQLPSKTFRSVVTSPPFNIRNSTGNGFKNNARGRWPNAGLNKGYDGYDDNMPHADYVAWQRRCLDEMMRLTADDGAIFYNHTLRVQGGLLQDRADILEGFPVRQKIIWWHKAGVNRNPGYFRPRYQVIYLIAKLKFKLAPETIRYGDVWECPPAKGNDHPAPMPVEIAARCVEASGAGAILDPFLGSGTTALAARSFGNRWVGIEQSPKYVAQAAVRLAA